MRRSFVLLLLLACTDQRTRCHDGLDNGRSDPAWNETGIARCVTEAWTDREIRCVVGAGNGGSMQELFCFPQRSSE